MENTLENKARFFALYWGQEVLIKDKERWNVGGASDQYQVFTYYVKNSYLELTPLSQITDEDAIEVAKMLFRDTEIRNITRAHYALMFEWRASNKGRWFQKSIYWKSMNTKQTDFIRLKGHALPFMGVSVETLIEWGWVKLKEKL